MLSLILTIPEAVIAAILVAVGTFAIKRVGRVHKDIAYLVEQWKPNGGGSLYDRFTLMEGGIKAVGEKLRVEQSSRYFIWNNRPESLWECDSEGRCLWGNKALAEMFGIETASLRGYGWLQAVRHDYREKALKRWNESVASRIPYEDIFIVSNRKTGEQFKVRSFAEAIEVDGSQRLFFGSCERLKAEV